MSERAEARAPAEAAAEAVKAYVRMNREKLAQDGELLALLLPERFAPGEVRDFQRFVIDRLAAENAKLKSERDGLIAVRDAAAKLGAGVRRLVLELLDARTFEEAIGVATSSAPAFSASHAVLCIEGEDGIAPTGTKGVRLISPGTANLVLGRDGMGAILSGGGGILLGPGGDVCRSLAVFRLKIGHNAPAALFVLGAEDAGRFEGDEAASDLRYFARALERAIRAWLDLPKI